MYRSVRQLILRKLLALVRVVGVRAATSGRGNVGGQGFGLASESEDDLGLAPYDLALAEIEGLLENAVADEDTWLGRFRAGLGCLVDLFETRPELGRVLFSEIDSGKITAQRRWSETLKRAARFVDQARNESEAFSPPQITADAVVTGIYGVLRSELLGSTRPELRAAIPDLTYYAVLPYFGAKVARREMAAARR